MNYVLYLLLLLSVFAVPLASTAIAQTTGTCPRSQGEAYLDVGNVRARILNNGALFYRGEPHVYEVPKGSGLNALFATSIWIGGRIDGTIHAAATRYGEWEFWPGPLDDHGNPPVECARYDRLWEITRKDIVAFNKTGVATANLLDWPWRLGAPVLDGDGVEGNYDLKRGDRPALIGDQMIWWVMNDRGNIHESTDSPPIGIEVHGSAFAFHRPGSYIDNVTFYRYKLINKNRAPFEDAYFGLYSDPDLGNFDDDYIGSDSTLHLGFVYNSDNHDEGGWGYGKAPPALGYTFLRSALADGDGRDNDRDRLRDEAGERLGMAAVACFLKGGGGYGEPRTALDYYRCLQGRWKNGQRITLGGYGIEFSDIPTTFAYPGDPVAGAFWSEVNTDGQGTARQAGDIRFSTSTGPFTMQPDDEQEIIFAIVWARGTDHLDSVTRLKATVKRLHDVADAILVPDVPAPPVPLEPNYTLGFAQSYPNPFTETTTIRYSVPQPMAIRLRIYDVLGREVAVLVEERQMPGLYTVDFDGTGLPGGVYVYRIEMDHLRFTKPMTLIR